MLLFPRTMSDEAVIKRKLIFDGDGTGEDKKVQAFMKLLPKYILSDDTSDNSEPVFNKLLAQLSFIIVDRKRSDFAKQSNAKQKETFKNLQTIYEGNIKLIKKDIEEQKQFLRKAKMVKQNSMEYDLFLKTVNTELSRKELTEQMDILKKDIQKLQDEKENLNQQLNSKVKQCYVLSTSANTLKQILQDEKPDCENQMDITSIDIDN